MQEHNLEEALMLARNGDLSIREELIQNHKNFIVKVSSKICKRYLTWDNDDELSVALLAFNEAIDNYKTGEGAAFHSFAQQIIKNRLIDYFRKESKHMHISLSPMNSADEEVRRYDQECSYEQYQEEEKQAVLAEVIETYIKALREYGVTLDDLVKVSPKHRNRKETLILVARKLVNEPSLLEYLKKYKQLPIKELKLEIQNSREGSYPLRLLSTLIIEFLLVSTPAVLTTMTIVLPHMVVRPGVVVVVVVVIAITRVINRSRFFYLRSRCRGLCSTPGNIYITVAGTYSVTGSCRFSLRSSLYWFVIVYAAIVNRVVNCRSIDRFLIYLLGYSGRFSCIYVF